MKSEKESTDLKNKFYYTYWIIDTINNMYYHGVRSSEKEPELDRKYYSSSKSLIHAI